MKKEKTPRPPKWATWLLSLYCRPELLEDLEGDLNEFFDRNVQRRGAFVARLIYIIDVLKFFRPYTVRKTSFSHPLIRKVMLANYFKTSGRAILHNKLFSSINIFGMAVSMSVGLLVIAFVSDLFSYDSTLQNKERIFRVVTSYEPTGQPPMKLASTSWKASQLIRQEIPGVESIANLRRGFSGDARIGANTIPVDGLYADQGFFDVFSYRLVAGSEATALQQPHSLVLTRSMAKKLFGQTNPMGKFVQFDTVNYTVTGLMEDQPKLSHLPFQMLVSLSSVDLTSPHSDGDYMEWGNVFSNYVYVLLSKIGSQQSFMSAMDRVNHRENASIKGRKIFLSLQPVGKIPIGKPMGNEIGPVLNVIAMYMMAGLALVIILSACFNYTNLSLARSLRRSREVGIRKVMGAARAQVIGQFIAESVIISLLSLCLAFIIFLVLRRMFLSFHEQVQSAFSLSLSPQLILYFILLSIAVGFIAGVLPALFYSKINAVQALKNSASLKVFRHVSLRKALVVVQYTFSLIFITATVIGYHQYKSFLRFDLGFRTDHILNIRLQGNSDEVLTKELTELSSVKNISRSLIISSLGSMYGSNMKYKDPTDSAQVMLNYIDEHYLPLHQYRLLAGRNFTHQPVNAPETEVVVNEQLIKRFDIGHRDPEKAVGEAIAIGGKKLTIVGVLRDFHYGTLESTIDPTALRYSAQPGGYLNVKMGDGNVPATMAAIRELWSRIDKVHPLDAKFYDDQIEEAYSQFSVMLKVIGFFALLAICISSLGLFGMVIYTMEKRVKEVSIRKVLGAGDGGLMYLLSKGFLFLLIVSAMISLPLTWLFFEKVVLRKFAYHQPIGFNDLFSGLFLVAFVALAMIGIQTFKIVRANPANVLKNE